MHREIAGLAYTVQRAEFAGLEDDLEMGIATGFLDGHDLVEYEPIVAGQKRTARDHHVDLGRASVHGHARVVQFHGQRSLAAGKRRRNGGDIDVAALECVFRNTDHGWIDTDRSDVRQARHCVVQVNRFLAELPHLAGCVLTLERCQVDHRQDKFERFDFRGGFDAAALESRNTLVDANFIDDGYPAQVGQIGGNGYCRQTHIHSACGDHCFQRYNNHLIKSCLTILD